MTITEAAQIHFHCFGQDKGVVQEITLVPRHPSEKLAETVTLSHTVKRSDSEVPCSP